MVGIFGSKTLCAGLRGRWPGKILSLREGRRSSCLLARAGNAGTHAMLLKDKVSRGGGEAEDGKFWSCKYVGAGAVDWIGCVVINFSRPVNRQLGGSGHLGQARRARGQKWLLSSAVVHCPCWTSPSEKRAFAFVSCHACYCATNDIQHWPAGARILQTRTAPKEVWVEYSPQKWT